MKTHGAGVWHGAFALCIAGVFAAAPGIKAQAAAPTEKPATNRPANFEALFVSDIHFEPFWDPAKAAKLKATPVGEWNAILAEPASEDQAARFAELQQTCKARGADTSYTLYESSLRAIRDDASGAKFVVLSGDLISHDFLCKYERVFPKDRPGEYRAFVEKTIGYVMRELRGALPGVPVYAALGNNDSDCGDYQLDPDSAFLKEIGKTLTADFPAGERAEALRTFDERGFYSARLPAPLEHVRMLVLDDLFMSRQYATCSGMANPTPAAAQIVWLEQQLDAARRGKEKVWVMSHIPPGVNPYATATKVLDLCSGGKPTMFLKSEALPDAMSNYGDVIELAIFAHTHMDEMRLLKPAAAGAPAEGVAIKMVGSISPIDGNNPSFTVAEIDAATAQLKDYRVIVASNQTGVDTQWTEEYDFAETYKEDAFTATSEADLITEFKADPTAKTPASQSYIRNFGSGSTARDISAFWQPYTCALRNDGADAFRECVCGK
ncbi:MAG: metallophosphoesterase [Terracidiphilus sp.]|jgi:sphingomyelin phosphodiesterase acid-like 3